jgi:hypothetical protein
MSLYSVIRLIIIAVRQNFPYRSRIFFRSSVGALSFCVGFGFFVLNFNPDAPGKETFQILVIALGVATCLSFFFSIQEWNAICHFMPYHPCAPDLLMIIAIAVAVMFGVCQTTTFFIPTPASPYVFFYINSLTLCVQMCFIIGYGCFQLGITFRTLEETDSYYQSPGKCISVFVLVLALFGAFEFASFLASFCLNLDEQRNLRMFTVFCERVPLMVSIPSSLILQDLMDNTAHHISQEHRAVDVTLI